MKFLIEGETYEWDQRTLMNTEAIKIQKVTGYRLKEFAAGLEEGDVMSLTALVWIMKLRAGETIAFDDVSFDLNSIESVPDPQEPSAS